MDNQKLEETLQKKKCPKVETQLRKKSMHRDHWRN